MNKDEELCYLMNPTLYDKYKKLSSNEQHVQFIEEKKFYRKKSQMFKDCTRFQIFKDAEVPPNKFLRLITNLQRFVYRILRLKMKTNFIRMNIMILNQQ